MGNQVVQLAAGEISELAPITGAITDMFSTAKSAGITIVTGAIAIGVIFVAGAFIWSLAKTWLKRAKG